RLNAESLLAQAIELVQAGDSGADDEGVELSGLGGPGCRRDSLRGCAHIISCGQCVARHEMATASPEDAGQLRAPVPTAQASMPALPRTRAPEHEQQKGRHVARHRGE